MRYAVALSEHPDVTTAVGEVIGQTLERIGPGPDLAIIFLTGTHVLAAQEAGETVRATLGARTLLGATASSVLAHRQEVEETAAVVLWAGHIGTCRALRLESGLPVPSDIPSGSTLLVVADPFTYDPSLLLSSVPPGVNVVGGLASASSRPGGNRILLDADAHDHGAVAVILPPDIGAHPLVSQGCRPIGEPFTVTASEENLIVELGGRSAIGRLSDLVSSADEKTRALISRGLHVGLVVDEQREAFELGDFLIRAVVGIDRAQGAIAIGELAPVGTTVQFQIRDAATASSELRSLVKPLQAESALVFTCNGRGTHLFGRSGHDAEHLADGLATSAVAGMFCAGEMGPVGGRQFLHGFTASSLLLGTQHLV